jgi:drug/metabolite transporter (DMT)-like permease
MSYYLTPILIVLGLVIYQISQKSTDQNANPFVVVIMAYLIGIAACVVGYFLFPRQDAELMPMMKTVVWSALGIGIGAASIEIGFMLAYRAGWNLSLLPVSVNVCGAVLLILIGLIAFRESLSMEKLIGVLMCIGGLVLITIRK